MDKTNSSPMHFQRDRVLKTPNAPWHLLQVSFIFQDPIPHLSTARSMVHRKGQGPRHCLCPEAVGQTGSGGTGFPLGHPHKCSHIAVCSRGRKWLEAPDWDMGHFCLVYSGSAFTGVNYSACVFKDSVNNYSGDGFFSNILMIFSSKDPFYRNRRRRKKYLFRACFMEAPLAGALW